MRLTTRGLLCYIVLIGVVLAGARSLFTAVIIDIIVVYLIVAHTRVVDGRLFWIFSGIMVGLIAALVGLHLCASISFPPDFYALRERFVRRSLPAAVQVGFLFGGTAGFVLAQFRLRAKLRADAAGSDASKRIEVERTQQ